jgi:hypothetical protein
LPSASPSVRAPRWSRPDPAATPVAAAAAGLFLVCFGLVQHWFWRRGALVDWPVYKTYGDAIVHHGSVPYRDFAVEYPPAALPAFVVPSLVGDYAHTFAWSMAVCGALLVAVLAYLRPLAAAYAAFAPLLVGSLILSRFDLWPALLATCALACLAAGRDRLGWALLGLGVAAKLWPVVLVPPALVWSARRGRGWAALAGLASLVVVCLPFAVVAPDGFRASIRTQADRPLQVESLGASLVTTFGRPQVTTSHGSQNVVGHGLLAAGFTAAQVAVLVALWLAFARGPATRGRLWRYEAACVCAFVALGKVLSPQFLIWLVPLVPLVRGRRGLAATAALTAALVLTQVWFPRHYFAYALGFARAEVVLARNLVLLVLLAILACPEASRISRPPL